MPSLNSTYFIVSVCYLFLRNKYSTVVTKTGEINVSVDLFWLFGKVRTIELDYIIDESIGESKFTTK